MTWPVNGDTAKFHHDVMNTWDPAALEALVRDCLLAVHQPPDARDDHQPPAYVLNKDYLLP